MDENMHEDNEGAMEDWSKEDKLNLYNVLKCFGSSNMEAIQNALPDKSLDDIETAIKYYRTKAENLRKQKSGKAHRPKYLSNPRVPLASWAKFLTDTLSYKELQTETAAALRLIADLENIPPPVCTEGINFKQVYYQLANAMEGKPLPDDKVSKCILKKCIVETALMSKAFIKKGSFKFVIDSINISDQDMNTFPKLTDDKELGVLRHFAAQRIYNPLNIPEEHLKPSF